MPIPTPEVWAELMKHGKALLEFTPDESIFHRMEDWSVIKPRAYIQRPITDDMRQMLDDIGIDWPEFQPVSSDGKTFRWR